VNLPGSSILDLLHVYSALRRGNQHDDFRTAIGGIPNETTNLPRVNDPNLTLVYTKETDTPHAASAMPRKVSPLYCKLIRIKALVARILILGRLLWLCVQVLAQGREVHFFLSQEMCKILRTLGMPVQREPRPNSRSFSAISKNAQPTCGAFHRRCGSVSLRSFKLE
jgi:hypothetical protein